MMAMMYSNVFLMSQNNIIEKIKNLRMKQAPTNSPTQKFQLYSLPNAHMDLYSDSVISSTLYKSVQP